MPENMINTISLLFPKIKSGDEDALVRLFEAVDKCIYNIAFRILNDRGLAEDVLLETFDAFVNNVDRINKHEVVFDWLKVTARNKSLNIRKKRKRESIVDDQAIEYSINADNDVAATLDDKIIMDEALATLPENERTALLYRHKNYTYEEISELMGISVGKVRRLIVKAKNKLQKYFK